MKVFYKCDNVKTSHYLCYHLTKIEVHTLKDSLVKRSAGILVEKFEIDP